MIARRDERYVRAHRQRCERAKGWTTTYTDMPPYRWWSPAAVVHILSTISQDELRLQSATMGDFLRCGVEIRTAWFV